MCVTVFDMERPLGSREFLFDQLQCIVLYFHSREASLRSSSFVFESHWKPSYIAKVRKFTSSSDAR